MSMPRIVALSEYQRLIAKKMYSVPSVTMNGGSFRRVISAPLSRPQAVPTPKPSSSASGPGRPGSVPSLAITIDDRTMIAPTERSMPAVRMTSVWAMPSVPTTITCWTISDRFAGRQEAVGGDAEVHDREQQDEQRPERRVAVQDVVDAAAERVFARGRRRRRRSRRRRRPRARAS